MATTKEAMYESVELRDGSDCWHWIAGKIGSGYGYLRGVLAHRWFYEHFIGPIADGLCLDHLCRTPSCVNPLHLEPVTPGENTLRGKGLSAVNARKTRCPRGHSYANDGTYRTKKGKLSWSDGKRCRICAIEAMRRKRGMPLLKSYPRRRTRQSDSTATK